MTDAIVTRSRSRGRRDGHQLARMTHTRQLCLYACCPSPPCLLGVRLSVWSGGVGSVGVGGASGRPVASRRSARVGRAGSGRPSRWRGRRLEETIRNRLQKEGEGKEKVHVREEENHITPSSFHFFFRRLPAPSSARPMSLRSSRLISQPVRPGRNPSCPCSSALVACSRDQLGRGTTEHTCEGGGLSTSRVVLRCLLECSCCSAVVGLLCTVVRVRVRGQSS